MQIHVRKTDSCDLLSVNYIFTPVKPVPKT